MGSLAIEIDCQIDQFAELNQIPNRVHDTNPLRRLFVGRGLEDNCPLRNVVRLRWAAMVLPEDRQFQTVNPWADRRSHCLKPDRRQVPRRRRLPVPQCVPHEGRASRRVRVHRANGRHANARRVNVRHANGNRPVIFHRFLVSMAMPAAVRKVRLGVAPAIELGRPMEWKA